MPFPNPNQMLVEDHDTMGAIIGLMRRCIGSWGQSKNEWPVNIRAAGSADEVLQESGLVAGLQESVVKTLGIIVDGDENPRGRWERIRNFCQTHDVAVPNQCPPEGLIIDGVLGRRFGAWIMPNNQDVGMIENFCRGLIPSDDGLWSFAQMCAEEAKRKGASYVDAHRHKAEMHTWLAWQAPPGERMGSAITKAILRHDADSAQPFIQWFRTLYGV
jgi:uncharacterized protein DUF3226